MDERHRAILECLRSRRSRLSIRELAVATGIPRSTVHMLLTDLVRLGYIRATPGRWRGYRLAGRYQAPQVSQEAS